MDIFAWIKKSTFTVFENTRKLLFFGVYNEKNDSGLKLSSVFEGPKFFMIIDDTSS